MGVYDSPEQWEAALERLLNLAVDPATASPDVLSQRVRAGLADLYVPGVSSLVVDATPFAFDDLARHVCAFYATKGSAATNVRLSIRDYQHDPADPTVVCGQWRIAFVDGPSSSSGLAKPLRPVIAVQARAVLEAPGGRALRIELHSARAEEEA